MVDEKLMMQRVTTGLTLLVNILAAIANSMAPVFGTLLFVMIGIIWATIIHNLYEEIRHNE